MTDNIQERIEQMPQASQMFYSQLDIFSRKMLLFAGDNFN